MVRGALLESALLPVSHQSWWYVMGVSGLRASHSKCHSSASMASVLRCLWRAMKMTSWLGVP
eukprot:3866417-Rhodomonas_salina.1